MALPTGAPPASSDAQRVAWIDAARGYAVVAVILFHVVIWHFRGLEGVAPVGWRLWSLVGALLGGAGMPLLLAVSGLVLARRIRTGPFVGGTLTRVVQVYYLYVVWVVVYAVFYLLVRHPGLPHRLDGPVEVVAQLVAPSTPLWYLFALALYTAVLTLARRVPPVAVLTALTLLSTAVHTLDRSGAFWLRILELFVFFALGVYGAGVMRRLADRSSIPVLLGLLVLGLGLSAVRLLLPGWAGAVFFVPSGIAVGAAMVVLFVLLTRWRPARELGTVLGRGSLGLYVLHPLWLAGLALLALAVAPRTIGQALGTPTGAVVYPLLVTALIVALSLPLLELVRRARLGWLFAMPASWGRALDRLGPAPTGTPPVPGDEARDAAVGGSGRAGTPRLPADPVHGTVAHRPGRAR